MEMHLRQNIELFASAELVICFLIRSLAVPGEHVQKCSSFSGVLIRRDAPTWG